MAKKVVYIHGTYDLESEASRDAFNKRKAELNEQGYVVYTPFEVCLGAEGDEQKCIRLILRKLTECDHVHFIGSDGVKKQYSDCFYPIFYPMGITEI